MSARVGILLMDYVKTNTFFLRTNKLSMMRHDGWDTLCIQGVSLLDEYKKPTGISF